MKTGDGKVVGSERTRRDDAVLRAAKMEEAQARQPEESKTREPRYWGVKVETYAEILAVDEVSARALLTSYIKAKLDKTDALNVSIQGKTGGQG